MSTLIAIGYPDETTATAAGDEAEQLAKDLLIQPDAMAENSTASTRPDRHSFKIRVRAKL